MKRIVLSIIGCTLLSLSFVQGQQQQQTDTTGRAARDREQNRQYDQPGQQRDDSRMNREDAWQQQSDRGRTDQAYTNEGMVMIDKNEIPPALKKTLKQDKYAGWENATIYHNTNTGEYVIAPRAYRFDKNGKEMAMDNANQGYGNQQQRRSSRYSPGQQGNQTDQRESQQSSQYRSRDTDNTGQTPESASKDRTGNTDQFNQQSQTDQAQMNRPSQSDNASETDQAKQDNQSSQGDQSSQPGQRSQTDQSSQAQQRTDNDQSSQGRQPSTSYRQDQQDRTGAGTQTQPGRSGREKYSTEDMTEVQAEQIPASLRRTLSERKYKGWEEKGTLYQDPTTNEYVLVMDKSGDASQQTYRFDKNGQPKESEDESTQSKQDQ